MSVFARRVGTTACCALATGLAWGLAWGLVATPAAAVSERELVEAFLARDAAEQRAALLVARREAAELARASEPTWRVEALHEESTSSATAFTSDVLSVGVELDLARANEAERRRAEAELAAERLVARAELVDAVTQLRGVALATSLARREAEVLRSERERVASLLEELARLVEGGERSRFDLDHLRAFAATRGLREDIAAARARSEAARLAALAGRDASDVTLGAAGELPPRDEVIARVVEAHPLLAALRSRVRQGRFLVELAGKSHPGRLDLRAGYRIDDEPGLDAGDAYEIEAAYTLPSRALRRHEAAVARTEKSAWELTLARAERRVIADVESALARLEALEGITAEGNVDAVREGSLRRYRAGEATLSEVLDVLARMAERELLDLEIEGARRDARIELDRAAGLLTAPELERLVEESLP